MRVKSGRVSQGARTVLALALLLGVGLPLAAEEAKELTLADALREGEPIVRLRYRWEHVSEAGWSKDANASTILAQIGYRTAKWRGLWALAEYQGNFAVPATQYYNSLANGRIQYPVVADPVDQEMAQAFLAYSFQKRGDMKFGLQKVNFVNQRYVGSVAWRQLEQIFSGATYKGNVWRQMVVHYAYLGRVVRVFGEHNPNTLLQPQSLNSHVLDVSYKFKPGTLHGYVHLFDVENWEVYPSHKNIGVRFDGTTEISEKVTLLYTGEYARQTDFGGSPPQFPDSFSYDYLLARFGVKVAGVNVRLGHEVLGGDGTYAFQTPFATLHKFNGFADRFLLTPDDGLRDTYVEVFGTYKEVKLLLRYHRFDRDEGSERYGKEWNFNLFRSLGNLFGIGFRYARYDARANVPGATPATPIFDRDVDKAWIWLQMIL